MESNDITRRTALKSISATALLSASALPVAANEGGLKNELAEVRSATAEYNDPATAYDAGYRAGHPLENVVEDAHSVCGMGFHLVKSENIGTVDRTKPQVLVYGVAGDGTIMLGAVEYLVPKALGYEDEPPSLFEHDGGAEVWQEDSPKEGLWSLHVWVHTNNPNGVFAPFNPRKQFSPDGCFDPRDGHEH